MSDEAYTPEQQVPAIKCFGESSTIATTGIFARLVAAQEAPMSVERNRPDVQLPAKTSLPALILTKLIVESVSPARVLDQVFPKFVDLNIPVAPVAAKK